MAVRYSWVGPEWDYQDAGPEVQPTQGRYYLNGQEITQVISSTQVSLIQASLYSTAQHMNAMGQMINGQLREIMKGVRFTR